MTAHKLDGRTMNGNVRKSLRAFALVVAFLVALDACIAINRWWLAGGFQDYMWNLVVMVVGFTIFIILASRSKTSWSAASYSAWPSISFATTRLAVLPSTI